MSRPFALITATLDGDILSLLAAGETTLTGREISRRIGASQEGVRQALERLVSQGIVLREPAGNAHLFSLNRQHLAAPWIERIASLPLEFIDRLRQRIQGWSIRPVLAALFGSAARQDMTPKSDIDILIIRSAQTDGDDPVWHQQLSDLESYASALTGNDARITEYSDSEVQQLRGERLLMSVATEGIELFGSLSSLRIRRRKARTRP